MNIFGMIKSLYEEKNTKWIEQLSPEDLKASHPIVLTKFLAMNKHLTWQLPILNEYSIILDTEKFLFLAWALVPKQPAPFCRYVKPVEDKEFNFMWDKFKHFTGICGNDFRGSKKRFEEHFKENMRLWFSDFGVEKKYWKKYKIPLVMGEGNKGMSNVTNLGAWFG